VSGGGVQGIAMKPQGMASAGSSVAMRASAVGAAAMPVVELIVPDGPPVKAVEVVALPPLPPFPGTVTVRSRHPGPDMAENAETPESDIPSATTRRCQAIRRLDFNACFDDDIGASQS